MCVCGSHDCHVMQAGRAEHSFGIEVARIAGLPPEVVARAKVARNTRNTTSLLCKAENL